MDSCARPITTDLPSTLAKWSAYSTRPLIAVCDPLKAWFSSQSLNICEEVKRFEMVRPPVNELRAHDGTYGIFCAPLNIAYIHRVCEHVLFHSVQILSELTSFSEREQFTALLELWMDAMC